MGCPVENARIGRVIRAGRAVVLLGALLGAPVARGGEGPGVELQLEGSAVTLKPEDKPRISYADQPGSGLGGLLRVRGRVGPPELRWIAGLLVERLQRGAFVSAGESGVRLGGQLGLGWMLSTEWRLEGLLEAGRSLRGTDWFTYIGVRPGVTWTSELIPHLGAVASLALLLRKELQPENGPLAPAGGRELGLSLAVGASFE